MAYPDIPSSVKAAMGSPEMRQHHLYWHIVRNEAFWNSLNPNEKAQLSNAGWQAPRFDNGPGAGIDFLGMHRGMVEHANHLFAQAGDLNWPQVIGWNPIPSDKNDSDWPVPSGWPGMDESFEWAKSDEGLDQLLLGSKLYEDESYLKTVTLDKLGTEIEWGIHGLMHNRWSDPEPGDIGASDWLGHPVSSHVNRHFWKLHGWIDEHIRNWEVANDATADLTSAWSGPSHMASFSAELANAVQESMPRQLFRMDRAVLLRVADEALNRR